MSNRVVFFGTPKIAVSCLQALLDANLQVVAVVTKPDVYIGRKQILQKSDVKIFANEHHILVLQPVRVNEIYDELLQLHADLFVVCAYGKLISEKILQIPPFHCVNIHTSLLPRWRGGAPIHYAVWSGDKQTGVSLMFMTKELDAGNIIYQQAIPIDDKETYHSLYIKLAQLSYRVLIDKIHSLFTSHVPSQPQDIQFVTIAKNITRENEKINWNNSNLQIERQIRGLFDKPIAYTTYINFDVKIYEATCLDLQTETHPGTIVQISKNGMDVACGNHQILKITKLQLPGKKPIYLKDMVNGHHPFKVNHQFNS